VLGWAIVSRGKVDRLYLYRLEHEATKLFYIPSGWAERFPRTALLLEAGWRAEMPILWLMSSKGACCAEGLVDAAANCDQLTIPRHLRSVPHRLRLVPIGSLAEGARLQFVKPQLSLTPG